MNEINIYAKYDYRKLIKSANLFFNKKYIWYNPKSVFAPYNGTFTIAFHKYNIHISYWDENTEIGNQEKNKIKEFLKENVVNMDISLDYDTNCDLVDFLRTNNYLLRG